MSLGLTYAQLRDAAGHLQGRARADVTLLALGEEPERVLRSIIDQPGLTGREIAKTLGVHWGTFQSRFARAGLPSPHTLIVAWRLALAAGLIARGATVKQAAECAGVSSPQSLGRTCREALGQTALATGMDPEKTYQAFVTTLLRERRDQWQRVRPVSGRAGCAGVAA
jgi:AraC-like DNA-binding protein